MATLGLKFYQGATPGTKRKPNTDEDKFHKSKKNARYERKFNPQWKEGRDWLTYDQDKRLMKCSVCIEFYVTGSGLNQSSSTSNLRGQNTFINGSSNLKISAVCDHENSSAHKKAVNIHTAAKRPGTEILKFTDAGRALQCLKEAERGRLVYLFRNAHAIMKNNRPMTDFQWLCSLDRMKGLDIGATYINNKAALNFIKSIAAAERDRSVSLLNNVNFFSFMMDGSTDISGDEQEALYIRMSIKGKVIERFLGIGTPISTCSVDLEKFVLDMFANNGIDKGKLVGMGSDGASNMVGKKGGLATLLKKNVNPEIVNVHCFAHRVELAFRDVLKTNKLYDKLMTLLIGLYYFYTKQHKNKRGLLESIAVLNIKGVLPVKVTGTRWLPHLSRGIQNLLRTFKAYEAHLSTVSHQNPKGEGLYKIVTSQDMMCFVLFLQEITNPLMRLSLKLQQPECTVADGFIWVQSTVDLLEEYKSRDFDSITEILESGSYEGIALRGKTPSLAYKEAIIDGFIQALRERFDLDMDMNVFKATRLLHLKNWPPVDSHQLKDFGETEVQAVGEHFRKTLEAAYSDFTVNGALAELKIMKKVLYKRFGSEIHSMTWDELYDTDFPMMMLVIEILNCFPPTSVTCETTFSQLKLIKTSRRTRLKCSTLDDILMVKLESPMVENYDPGASIDKWMSLALKPRLPNYQRHHKNATSSENDIATGNPVDITDVSDQETQDSANPTTENEADMPDTNSVERVNDRDDDTEIDDVNEMFLLMTKDDENDDFCEDFRNEDENWSWLFKFSREC